MIQIKIPITKNSKELYLLLKKYFEIYFDEKLNSDEFTEFIINNFIYYRKINLNKIKKEIKKYE